MGNFFNEDVPMEYQESIINKMLYHLEKENGDALCSDFNHYDMFFPLEVYKRVVKISCASVMDFEKVRELFQDYALI